MYYGKEFIEFATNFFTKKAPENFLSIDKIAHQLGQDKKRTYEHIERVLKHYGYVPNITVYDNNKLIKYFDPQIVEMINKYKGYAPSKPPAGWVSIKQVGKILRSHSYTNSFKQNVNSLLHTHEIPFGTFGIGHRRFTYYDPVIIKILQTELESKLSKKSCLSISQILKLSWSSRFDTTRAQAKMHIQHITQLLNPDKNCSLGNGIDILHHLNRRIFEHELNHRLSNNRSIIEVINHFINSSVFVVNAQNKKIFKSNGIIADPFIEEIKPLADKIRNFTIIYPSHVNKIASALCQIRNDDSFNKKIYQYLANIFVINYRPLDGSDVSGRIARRLYKRFIPADVFEWSILEYVLANNMANCFNEKMQTIIDQKISEYELKRYYLSTGVNINVLLRI